MTLACNNDNKVNIFSVGGKDSINDDDNAILSLQLDEGGGVEGGPRSSLLPALFSELFKVLLLMFVLWIVFSVVVSKGSHFYLGTEVSLWRYCAVRCRRNIREISLNNNNIMPSSLLFTIF